MEEAVIQEEMFKLEEKVTGDVDVYFDDLIKTYKKIIDKEVYADLHAKLLLVEKGTEDEKKLLQELSSHAKSRNS